MIKITTIIKAIGIAAIIGMIPYYAKVDEETGSFEVGALLWSFKKVAGEEQDDYVFELLPLVNMDDEAAEEA